MKKNKMRRLSAVLSVILSLSLAISGCSGNADKKDKKTDNQSEQLKELSFKVHTTYFTSSPQGTDTQKKWLEMMEKYMGMKLNITWEEVPWTDYNKLMPVYLASGDYADVMTMTGEANFKIDQKVIELGEAGQLVNIAKYWDKVKYYKAYTEDTYSKARITDTDGAIYTFMDGRNSNHSGTQLNHVVRFDTFQKNNIKPPETMDEYYSVAKKLKELYPQSYPVGSFRNNASLIEYFLSMNRTFQDMYYNGKQFYFGPVDDAERQREVLVFLNKLYSEGLLDPEFFVVTADQARQKMLTGKVYMVPNYSGSQVNDFLNFNKEYPDVKWGIINHPKNFRGEVSWNVGSARKGKYLGAGYNIGISTKTKYPELLVKLLDYQYSDEMLELSNWGIEGVTFSKAANGTKEYLPNIINAANPSMELAKYGVNQSMSVRSGIQFMPQEALAGIKLQKPTLVWSGGKYYEDNFNLFTSEKGGPDSVKPEAPPIVFDTNDMDKINNILTPIKTYLQELEIKVVTGKANISEWDKYIAGLKEKNDIKTVDDMHNKKLEEFKKTYGIK